LLGDDSHFDGWIYHNLVPFSGGATTARLTAIREIGGGTR